MEAPRGGSERDHSNSSSVVSSFWKESTAVLISELVYCYFTGLDNFDLEKEKSVLDEQGLRIAEHQENSLKNRRKLAESTRDFKKASPEEKLSLFNTLLKGYQEEIDNLTKRAKFGENAFLNIYQKLYEAPDPYPALEAIAEQQLKLSELESENRNIKLELEEFRTEATHLKNQQAIIRRLEERNQQVEQQMEEKVKELVEIKHRSLTEENQKTMEVLKEREDSLQDQLRQAQESVSNMQKIHELAQNKLFELCAQSEEERAAKQSEVNLLMDEVERSQTRLLSLEREKGVLRSQLKLANEDTEIKKSYNLDSNSMLENSLNVNKKRISELNMELHNLETALSNEREEHMNDVKKLTAMLSEKETTLVDMKKELQSRPTAKMVDELRKKVKILQAEDWEVATSGGEMSNMESLLLEKNRKMEHELTQMKVKLSEKTSLLETAEQKIAELTVKINEQQKLIQKLEDDILKGYSSSKDHKGTFLDDWDVSEAGGAEASEGSDTDRHALLLCFKPHGFCMGDCVPLQSKLWGQLISTIAYSSLNTDEKQTSLYQDQSSMLKVICHQRDRFRTRLRETEEEVRKLKEKIGVLTVELEKTKADNVKLYGTIRYVQDYNLAKVVSRGSKKYADLENGLSSDVESKYKKIYEDNINPFAAFSKKERDQRYKELGFRERITLSSGRFLLGNKYARTFAFFYTIGLHILVFACLYRMSALSYLSNGSEESLTGEKIMNFPRVP
ncbi:protein CASP [Senna tora]|uniref:Protein CASP n=1 Tax=Senna tora TaxID=362788 RepID=A0A834T4T5_9FABA|nr:protein CASP [Senna tora]